MCTRPPGIYLSIYLSVAPEFRHAICFIYMHVAKLIELAIYRTSRKKQKVILVDEIHECFFLTDRVKLINTGVHIYIEKFYNKTHPVRPHMKDITNTLHVNFVRLFLKHRISTHTKS